MALTSVSNGSREQGESVASKEAQVKKERAEKGERSFKEMATRNVASARKAIPNEEGDKTATAEHLIRSAMVYAVLDLADAVRGGSDDATLGKSVSSG
jgi:recombinational DNA repair protein RecT